MHRSIIPALAALVLFVSQASAQRFNLRKPPELLDEISIGVSFMLPCNAKISNLGTISNTYNDKGAYLDAEIYPDTTYGTDQDDGKTYNFLYYSIMQLTDANGNPNFEAPYLKATNVKADPVDGNFDESGDSGVMKGIDINYTRYMSRKHKLGITAGVTTSGMTFQSTATWDVNLTAHYDIYAAYGLEGIGSFTGNIERPRVFSEDEPEVYISYTPINDEPIEYDLDQTTTAEGTWDLKNAYIAFRLGAVYNFTLTRRWLMHLGGGLTALSASSRFRWYETYSVTLDSGEYDVTVNEIKNKHKFLFGGWADLGAQYRISRYVNVYTTMQMQSTTSMNYTTKFAQKIDLDSSSMYSVKTGFSWSF